MGGWEDAIDYFTQNSLIFQELYFPRDSFQKINMPFLSDITTSYQGKPFKNDFRKIYSIMEQKGIGRLYHFTDVSNNRMGLDDFVRLSFVKKHPMLYTAMTSQGIRPIIIEINPLIALMPEVYFSDKNALRSGANIGDSYEDLGKVRFEIVLGSKDYYDLSLERETLISSRSFGERAHWSRVYTILL